MNRKVSLIVPAYNVKEYIRKCITSIENQTYQNYELIIIDDGSTDGTTDIINEIAACNSKIKVLNGGHKGVSNARNMGLDCVEGEYVTFVDSDNFWLGAFSKVLKGAEVRNGCIVGLGSIVTSKNINENAIIVGNPAKEIKKGFSWSREELVSNKDGYFI